MHRRYIVPILALSALIAGIGLPAIVHAQDDCNFAGEARIGIIAPLTGAIYRVGQSTVTGAELAIDQINAACGLQIGGENYEVVPVLENNNSEPETSVEVATRLITEENVIAIIGPQASSQAVPTAEVANEYETPMISPWSTNPNTTLDHPWVFRVALLDPWQGQIIANFAMQYYDAQTAAVLYSSDSDYPRGLAENFREAFEAAGGQVVAFEDFLTGVRDFRSQLDTIKDSNPDVLFVPQYYNEVPRIVLRARDSGYNGPIIGSDSWGTPELLELCNPFCDGLFFSAHYAPEIVDPAFIDAYQERYQMVPDDVAALTYDAFQFLFQAIEDADSLDRAAIRDALANIREFDGVTGHMIFNEQGDPTKCAVINQIVEGQVVYYESVCPADFPGSEESTPEQEATPTQETGS